MTEGSDAEHRKGRTHGDGRNEEKGRKMEKSLLLILLITGMVFAQGSAPILVSPTGGTLTPGTVTFHIDVTASGWHTVVVAPLGTTGECVTPHPPGAVWQRENLTIGSRSIDVNCSGMDGDYKWWAFMEPVGGGPPYYFSVNCWDITFECPVPSQPILIEPCGGSDEALPVTLDWNNVTGATGYRAQIANNSGMTGAITRTCPISEYEFIESDYHTLGDPVRVWWKAQAENACGWGVYSLACYFDPIYSEPPDPPTLDDPNDGDDICDATPKYDWYASSGADEYWLQVSTSSSFSPLEIDVDGITNTYYTPGSGLPTGDTYYWHVKAGNTAGWSDWSSTWDFHLGDEYITIWTPPNLYVGDTFDISWDYCMADDDEVDIEYSTNGGGTWLPIAINWDAGINYPWTVPNTPSDNCRMKVSNASGGSPENESGLFEIVSPASIADIDFSIDILGNLVLGEESYIELTFENTGLYIFPSSEHIVYFLGAWNYGGPWLYCGAELLDIPALAPGGYYTDTLSNPWVGGNTCDREDPPIGRYNHMKVEIHSEHTTGYEWFDQDSAWTIMGSDMNASMFYAVLHGFSLLFPGTIALNILSTIPFWDHTIDFVNYINEDPPNVEGAAWVFVDLFSRCASALGEPLSILYRSLSAALSGTCIIHWLASQGITTVEFAFECFEEVRELVGFRSPDNWIVALDVELLNTSLGSLDSTTFIGFKDTGTIVNGWFGSGEYYIDSTNQIFGWMGDIPDDSLCRKLEKVIVSEYAESLIIENPGYEVIVKALIKHIPTDTIVTIDIDTVGVGSRYSCFMDTSLIYIGPPDTTLNDQFAVAIGGLGHDHCFSIIQTSDGGYAIAGRTEDYGAGNNDLYILKMNQDFQFEWAKAIGGSNIDGNSDGAQVVQTSDKGFVIASDSYSFSSDRNDLFVTKLDSLGNFIWSKSVDADEDWDEGYSICLTTDGGLIATSRSHTSSNKEIMAVKFNDSGTVLWKKKIGGGDDEEFNKVISTSDGGCLIVGHSWSYTGNFIVVKLNSTGNLDWARSIGNTPNYDSGFDAMETPEGKYVVIGYTRSYGAGSNDILIVGMSSSGAFEWARTVGGADQDYGYGILSTPDSGFVVTGETESFGSGDDYLFLAKFNNSADMVWFKAIGSAMRGYSAINTDDGGFALVGYTWAYIGGRDIFLFKTDSLGVSCIGNSESPTVMNITPTFTGISPSVSSISAVVISNTPTITDFVPEFVNICDYEMGIREGEKQLQIPERLLLDVRPNPFNSSVSISATEWAEIEIFDINGRIVGNIPVGDAYMRPAGGIYPAPTIWQPDESLGSGVYLVRATIGDESITKRVVYLK